MGPHTLRLKSRFDTHDLRDRGLSKYYTYDDGTRRMISGCDGRTPAFVEEVRGTVYQSPRFKDVRLQIYNVFMSYLGLISGDVCFGVVRVETQSRLSVGHL